ncbi:hypothetical protein L1987_13518 [Smallanthus sonchifolius]|uniref:Uncharacterized protein n=1 Tax=Smallanthus sonchifolius TaxID=185202 RepID=A0ACB9JIW5_9ASTR|nr:hypothetical protein L1987_13518 [Smallanthus sonchifolius]
MQQFDENKVKLRKPTTRFNGKAINLYLVMGGSLGWHEWLEEGVNRTSADGGERREHPGINHIPGTSGNKSSSGGMSGGKKAGISIGVIVAACVIVFGGMLYRKRRQI